MRMLVLCSIASLVTLGSAQTTRLAPKTASHPAAASAPAKPSSATSAHFTAAGLNNEDDLVRIYAGDFQSVQLDRGDLEFMLIISGYMEDFGKDCKQFLPSDKVEITQQVCNDASVSLPYSPDGVHDIYGNAIRTSGCSGYHTEGTGVYADPRLYAAVNDVSAQAQANMVKNMLGRSTGRSGRAANPFTMGAQLNDKLVAVAGEPRALINANGCGSPSLKNFQSNLIRFANGENPVKYAGAIASAPIASPSVGPPKDADYTRLLDDLVTDNARGWMMNRYQPGSISDPIVSHDPRGFPVRIMARYSYSGSQGRQSGRVTVSFKDGTPDCLYFSDAPDTCRAASQRVISAFEKNAYAKREEENNRQSGTGTGQSPAAYDPQWMGKNVAIAGTVSRVDVDTSGSPQWVTIYFKESPDATFVVCSPYPDLFQERVGHNLSALVGKTLDATGQVESPYCGKKVSKGSIRVVESKQWEVH
jgi:hypothetical protein